MTSSGLNFVQIRIRKGGRSPRNRALYAETQNGPLSKLMYIAELQQVATTLLVAEFSLSL